MSVNRSEKCLWPVTMILGAFAAVLTPSHAYAFSKLKSGFENLTSTYLIPLSHAMAGAALIAFVLLSFFKKDEYQKQVGNILALTIVSSVGLNIIEALTRTFS